MKQPWFSDKQIANALHQADSDPLALDARRLAGASAAHMRQRHKKQKHSGSGEVREARRVRAPGTRS